MWYCLVVLVVFGQVVVDYCYYFVYIVGVLCLVQILQVNFILVIGVVDFIQFMVVVEFVVDGVLYQFEDFDMFNVVYIVGVVYVFCQILVDLWVVQIVGVGWQINQVVGDVVFDDVFDFGVGYWGYYVIGLQCGVIWQLCVVDLWCCF